MKKTTIKDLSRITNLSLGTISKYLNGGKIKDNSETILKNAIEKTNYRVDEYARGMKSKNTKIIGIIVPELFNHFYALLVSKIESQLTDKEYLSIVLENHSSMEREKKLVNWLVSRRVCAIICVTAAHTEKELAIYKSLDIPVLFVDKYIVDSKFDYILVNNEEISYIGVNYLIENGHEKIAFIGAQKNSYTAFKRYEGYRKAFEKNSLAVNPDYIFFLDEQPTTAYEAVKELLKKRECTAIFSSNYTTTLGTIFSINELKLEVPEDISILGFDNIYLTELYKTTLSIINQPINDIAQKCVERLFEKLAYIDEIVKTIYINATLIIGDSILNRKEPQVYERKNVK